MVAVVVVVTDMLIIHEMNNTWKALKKILLLGKTYRYDENRQKTTTTTMNDNFLETSNRIVFRCVSGRDNC